MKFCNVLLLLALTLGTLALAFENTQAARLGGGRSFGGKPFMSVPAPPPQATRPSQVQPSRESAAVNRPAQAPQNRGMFGGMGGLFGGLLAGTLIGSLLAGHGFAGGGFLDILVIGLLIYLGLKIFAGRRRPAEAPAGGQNTAYTSQREFAPERTEHASGWGRMRSNVEDAPQASIDVPDGFDTEEFLRGAKMAYTRLQESWDKRDLDDIAHFTTPAVLEKVREDMVAASAPSTTELLLVNAQLLHVETTAEEERAEVFFDVLMRESPEQHAPASVREIWHFLRTGSDDRWKLDGIQQVE